MRVIGASKSIPISSRSYLSRSAPRPTGGSPAWLPGLVDATDGGAYGVCSAAWLGSGVVEFGRRQQGAAVFAASDQNFAVREQGGGGGLPGCVHRASRRPGAPPGMIQFGRRQVDAAAIAPGDQDGAFLEQGGGVTITVCAHEASRRPGARTGIIDFGRGQGDAIVIAPGDQDGAIR